MSAVGVRFVRKIFIFLSTKKMKFVQISGVNVVISNGMAKVTDRWQRIAASQKGYYIKMKGKRVYLPEKLFK